MVLQTGDLRRPGACRQPHTHTSAPHTHARPLSARAPRTQAGDDSALISIHTRSPARISSTRLCHGKNWYWEEEEEVVGLCQVGLGRIGSDCRLWDYYSCSGQEMWRQYVASARPDPHSILAVKDNGKEKKGVVKLNDLALNWLELWCDWRSKCFHGTSRKGGTFRRKRWQKLNLWPNLASFFSSAYLG